MLGAKMVEEGEDGKVKGDASASAHAASPGSPGSRLSRCCALDTRPGLERSGLSAKSAMGHGRTSPQGQASSPITTLMIRPEPLVVKTASLDGNRTQICCQGTADIKLTSYRFASGGFSVCPSLRRLCSSLVRRPSSRPLQGGKSSLDPVAPTSGERNTIFAHRRVAKLFQKTTTINCLSVCPDCLASKSHVCLGT